MVYAFGIGLTDEAALSELDALASGPDRRFFLSNFTALSLVTFGTAEICELIYNPSKNLKGFHQEVAMLLFINICPHSGVSLNTFV